MLAKTYKTLPLNIVEGKGCYVYDNKGKKYLDLYSGHAVASTGHCHPRFIEAVTKQLNKLTFYSSAVESDIRNEAATMIIKHAPSPLSSVFFVNSGAEANEAALKTALVKTKRKKIIAMRKSFHGRTLLSFNVTDREKYQKHLPITLENIIHVEFNDINPLKDELDEETAAVILEPIQSMAGVITASDDYLKQVRELTWQNGTILIFDEVQTAPARTGTIYYSGVNGVIPDIMTLAKGIASGLPAGAVVFSRKIAEDIEYGELGSTFGGGPVASAAILATYQIIIGENLLENVKNMSHLFYESLEAISAIEEIRGKGLLIGLKLAREATAVQTELLAKGIITGTSSDPYVLRIMPPLNIAEDDISFFVETLKGLD